MRTASEPARLAVSLDAMGVKPVAGDLVFARARLLDAKDNPVPENGREVQFTASGGYEIVGSGMAATEAGIASVLVRVRNDKGAVRAQGGAINGAFSR